MVNIDPNKKVVILQSNYIPWKGYFDLMNVATDFVFYDCAQYTKNDWRNRNIITGVNGEQWLTIPIAMQNTKQRISEAKIASNHWHIKHWKALQNVYSRSQFFKNYADELYHAYEAVSQFEHLVDVNYHFIKLINSWLGITTKLHYVEQFELPHGRCNRLLAICQALEANDYYTGPAARSYLDVNLFTENGIKVNFFNYSGYRSYPQFSAEFSHQVSILDLLFHTGPDAKSYLLTNQPAKILSA